MNNTASTPSVRELNFFFFLLFGLWGEGELAFRHSTPEHHVDTMRLIDLSILIMAVASLLFPSPIGHLGIAYKVAALVLGIASLARLNWQVLPAVVVLAVRFILSEHLEISTFIYLLAHIPTQIVPCVA